MSEEILAGRNSVTEALRSGRSINKLLVQDGSSYGDGRGSVRRTHAGRKDSSRCQYWSAVPDRI